MRSQNTQPIALREAIDRQRALANDEDPIVRAAARELLHDLLEVPPPRQEVADRPPAAWHEVIGQVIAQEPHHHAARGFKTGHGHAHGSKSGTCVSVDVTRGVWYCSSCRRGGTAVTWVEELEQCSYGEAWQILVQRFGAEHA